MDVDVESITQVYKAYTEIDKKKHCTEGRCFECSKQGHMARECPSKKRQPLISLAAGMRGTLTSSRTIAAEIQVQRSQ